tara:strand:- start:184 stop:1227 length:1044 start_codon:yes stop_codon:yes gene_type:complete
MSQNTFCSPRLYVEDYGIIENISGSVNFPGNNQLIIFNAKIPGINVSESAILNREIKFYLNYGSEDSVPYFVGYIKKANSTDVGMSITAYDSRCFIAGEYALKIDLTDDFNYDGHTIGQFLFKHIKDYINIEKDYIDLSLMNDTNPGIGLAGVRAENQTPYQIVLEAIKLALDDSDPFSIFDYEVGVNFSNKGTSLFFIRQKELDKANMTLSYGDGIVKYNYTKNPLPNRARVGATTVDFGSTNSPRITKEVSDMIQKNTINKAIPSRALYINEAIKAIVRARLEKYEINIQATKGHYLQLGNIIHLNVDEEIRGKHKLISKSVSFNERNVTLNLKLNTRPITIHNY